jgi:hypothetical protein
MIQWIKNLFKKEEQITFDLERWRIQNENWHKMNLEKELYEFYRRAMNETRLYPDQTHIPFSFIYYVDKCCEYGMPQMALDGIERFSWLIQGTHINLDELKQRVYKTKEYKEYLVQKKLEQMNKDFE